MRLAKMEILLFVGVIVGWLIVGIHDYTNANRALDIAQQDREQLQEHEILLRALMQPTEKVKP